MLAVPGWLDSHRLPNAVAVVSALKKIARVRLDCSRFVLPDAPRRHVIDLERDADAEQQRQRDDVGEIERQPDQHADFQRHRAGHQQRHQRQQHVGDPPQRKPEQQADHDQRPDAGVDERLHDGVAGFENRHRPADRVRLGGQHGVGELAQSCRCRWDRPAAAPRRASARPWSSSHSTSSGGRVFRRDRLRLQRVLQLVEHDLQRRDEDRLRLVARRLIELGELRQRIGQPPRGDRARPLAVAGGLAQARRPIPSALRHSPRRTAPHRPNPD